MKYPKVLSVRPKENYQLVLTFENGEIKTFDVKPYIQGDWFGELENKQIFNSVRPCGNTIEWANGQDIAPHELYEMSKPV